ncbi:hypothetical protein HDU67_003507, partial [Dinochytrium kinnereticum]
CVRNWLAGGTAAVCNVDRNDELKYNRCLCQQYSNHAYCFQAFCPDDPVGLQLREEAVTACRRAQVTATIQTEILLATTSLSTASVATSAVVITSATTQTSVTPSSAPLTFPSGAQVSIPGAVTALVAGVGMLLAVRHI